MTRRNLTMLWAIAATVLTSVAYGSLLGLDDGLTPILATILGTCDSSGVANARADFTRCTATYAGREACTSCQAQFQTYADAARYCNGDDHDNFVRAQNDYLVDVNGCAGIVGRACPAWATPKACPGGGNCNGNGRCVNGACVCNDGYVGYACLSRAQAVQDSVLGKVAAKVQTAVDNYVEQCDRRCKPGQVLCPNWDSSVLPILANRRDKCVDNFVQCFTDVEHVPEAISNAVSQLRENCYRNASCVPFCGLLPGYVAVPSCLGNTTITSTYESSTDSEGNTHLRGTTHWDVQARVRCADGSCREDCSRVENHCSGDKPVMCPDGFTCKRNETECAAVMEWEGCPCGWYPCPARPRVCVKDLSSCERTCGCPEGTKFCGYRRNHRGQTVLDEHRRFRAICAKNCTLSEHGNCPSRTVVTVKPTEETHAPVKTRTAVEVSDNVPNRVACELRGAAGALKNAVDPAQNVAVSVNGVPDSCHQFGAFATLNDRGALRSPVVKVESEEPVTFDVSGNNNVTLHIALDEDIPAHDCPRCMSSLAVYRVDDPSDPNQTPERVAGCVATLVDGRCGCVAPLTSFSGYVVVDEQGVSDQEDAATRASAASGSASGHAEVNAAGSLKPSVLLAIIFGALLAALGML